MILWLKDTSVTMVLNLDICYCSRTCILSIKFPGTDLKGEPQCNSKIHVCKRQYVSLKRMFRVSSVD
ncbi:hypothetical protein ACS0TY_026738 [Phlomoides rotata]